MFGLSGTELAIVLVLALLLLGPSKLPELARGLGKAVRDFKRATNDIRGTVESEFYRMDQEPPDQNKAIAPPAPKPAEGAVAAAGSPPAPAVDPAPAAAEAKAKQLESDLAAPQAPPPAAKG